MTSILLIATYYLCDQKGCDYKAKQAGGVKTHKAFVHDINVIHYLCLEPGCGYQAWGSA